MILDDHTHSTLEGTQRDCIVCIGVRNELRDIKLVSSILLTHMQGKPVIDFFHIAKVKLGVNCKKVKTEGKSADSWKQCLSLDMLLISSWPAKKAGECSALDHCN
jgi:hypothetical protein